MLWVKLCPAHPFTQDWHIEVLTSDFFFWKWGPCRYDIAIMRLDWIFVQSIWIWCLCKEKRRERDRDTQAEWQVMMKAGVGYAASPGVLEIAGNHQCYDEASTSFLPVLGRPCVADMCIPDVWPPEVQDSEFL